MLKVRDSMTREVATLGPRSSVAQAWQIVRERGIRHIPIVEEGRLVGLVSDRDLRDASPVRKSEDGGNDENVFGWSSMSDIMATKLATIGPHDTIEHAAREIYDRRIGCLPVVDGGGELVGIITSSDMMRTLIELFGSEKPGAWLEVEVPNEPGALAGVVAAVSDRHVNLSSVFVAPGHRVSDRVIALRLETTNPKSIVEALEGAGYPVEVVESTVPVEPNMDEK